MHASYSYIASPLVPKSQIGYKQESTEPEGQDLILVYRQSGAYVGFL